MQMMAKGRRQPEMMRNVVGFLPSLLIIVHENVEVYIRQRVKNGANVVHF
jgi:hypothetical protein